MKRSKGFFLVYELLCLGFGCVLLAAAAQGFAACFAVQQRALQLEEGWQAAQRGAAGLEAEEKYRVELQEGEQNGYGYVEVRAVAAEGGKTLCTLVESRP
ncbi:MAG: hypothetical protein ACI3WS_07095 [Phascolarctobacterium sp.]